MGSAAPAAGCRGLNGWPKYSGHVTGGPTRRGGRSAGNPKPCAVISQRDGACVCGVRAPELNALGVREPKEQKAPRVV